MLVAPYKQDIELRRVSLLSQLVLILTVVLGSNAPLEYFIQKQPSLIPLNTALWFCLYLISTCGLITAHGVNWISWLIRYRVLLVLLVLGAIILTPWSVEPTLSINRLVHLIGTTLVAIYIGFSLPMMHILRLLSVILVVLISASLIAGNMLPLYAWEEHLSTQALKGILDNKNSLGFWAGFSLLLFPWAAMQQKDLLSRFFWLCATLLALTVLIQSRSAGSIIATAIAITLIAYIETLRKFKLGFLAMSLLGLLLTASLFLIFNGLNVAELSGRSNDLTGRAEVWSQTWKLVQQRPLTGYGYGTLWFPTDATKWIQERYTDFTWLVFHAHNGALHLASEIGLPMVALALLFVIQQLVELVFCQLKQKHTGAIVALGFCLAFLISNYSEARFMQSRELFWLFFIAFPICLMRQVEVREIIRDNTTYYRPAEQQVCYPDEFIPNPSTKLAKLRELKTQRRLRRNAVARLTAPRLIDQ